MPYLSVWQIQRSDLRKKIDDILFESMAFVDHKRRDRILISVWKLCKTLGNIDNYVHRRYYLSPLSYFLSSRVSFRTVLCHRFRFRFTALGTWTTNFRIRYANTCSGLLNNTLITMVLFTSVFARFHIILYLNKYKKPLVGRFLKLGVWKINRISHHIAQKLGRARLEGLLKYNVLSSQNFYFNI